MQVPGRKHFLFLILAGVVGLAVFAPTPEEPKLRPQAAKAAGADTALAPRATSKVAATQAALAPPSALPARSAFGQAPAMSYRFAGRLVQDGVAKIFVTKGDTPVAVKVGDKLDDYLVESIGSQSIALVYPPLGKKVSIAMSAVQDGSGQEAAAPASLSPPPPQAPSTPAARPVPTSGAAPAPAVAAAPQAVAVGKGARVLWDGPAQVKMGANFSVALRVDSDQPISASPMQLRFDPAVLESVAVRPGKLYASEAGRGFTYRVNPDGAIFVGASGRSASGADTSAGAGGAELVVLVFKPLKPGATAEVSLSALNLQGPSGRALAIEALTTFRAPVTP